MVPLSLKDTAGGKLAKAKKICFDPVCVAWALLAAVIFQTNTESRLSPPGGQVLDEHLDSIDPYTSCRHVGTDATAVISQVLRNMTLPPASLLVLARSTQDYLSLEKNIRRFIWHPDETDSLRLFQYYPLRFDPSIFYDYLRLDCDLKSSPFYFIFTCAFCHIPCETTDRTDVPRLLYANETLTRLEQSHYNCTNQRGDLTMPIACKK